MDGQIRVDGELIGTNGRVVATPAQKGPRKAETYRGHVRNTWKAARCLPEWREKTAARIVRDLQRQVRSAGL